MSTETSPPTSGRLAGVEVLLMPGIKHVPHREATEQTLNAIADFSSRVLREHEGAMAAAAR